MGCPRQAGRSRPVCGCPPPCRPWKCPRPVCGGKRSSHETFFLSQPAHLHTRNECCERNKQARSLLELSRRMLKRREPCAFGKARFAKKRQNSSTTPTRADNVCSRLRGDRRLRASALVSPSVSTHAHKPRHVSPPTHTHSLAHPKQTRGGGGGNAPHRSNPGKFGQNPFLTCWRYVQWRPLLTLRPKNTLSEVTAPGGGNCVRGATVCHEHRTNRPSPTTGQPDTERGERERERERRE